MGSWNESCGFSNLPITCGTPVRFMLIYANKREVSEARYYGYDLWQPATGLFEGEYDDYGGVEFKPEVEQAFHAAAKAGGYDLGGTKTRSNTRINGEEYGSGNAVPWMMREDAYQMILSMPFESYDEDYNTVELTIAEAEARKRRKFSNLVSNWDNRLLGLSYTSYELRQLFSGREMATPVAYDAAFEALNERCGGRRRAVDAPQLPKEYTLVPWIEEAVEPLYALDNLLLALDLSRKMLHPMGGAGSQSWNDRAYDHIGKFLVAAAAEHVAECEDYG